jgi:hypothetical protein
MSCRRLKSPFRTALFIGLGAHLLGLFLFSFDRLLPAQEVLPRPPLIFVDLEEADFAILAEMVMLRDSSPISQPSRWTSMAPASTVDDGWFQDAPVSEMEPRLALLRSTDNRKRLQLPSPPTTENILREMNQRGFLRALNLQDPITQRPPGGVLQVTLEAFSRDRANLMRETFIFDLPEGETPLPNDDLWPPLELRVWVDPLGTIPPPLVLNSTGNELRDNLIFELIQSQLQRLNLPVGYYRLSAGL